MEGELSEHPLVGRDREASLMVRRVTTRGGVVCLWGPAGVGKTRLLDEVGARLAAGDHGVTRASGVAAGSSIPLAPFLHLMDAEMPTQSVAEGVQRLTARLGDSDSGVVVVDDAHLLDHASVLLVHQVARRGDSGVLLAWRSGESLADDLAGLRSSPSSLDLELSPLTRSETDTLVEVGLGGKADPQLLARVWGLASGNPLFTRELVRHGVESGSIVAGDRGWRLVGDLSVSPLVNDVIGRRVAHLDASARRVLEALAVGGDLPVDVLHRVGDRRSVEALRRAGLVADRDTGIDGITFAHDLHRQVVLSTSAPDQLDAARRSLVDVLGSVPFDPDLCIQRAKMMVELDEVDPGVVLEGAKVAFRRFGTNDAEVLAAAAERHGAGHEAKVVRVSAIGAQGRFEEATARFVELRLGASNPTELAGVAFAEANHHLMHLGDLGRAEALSHETLAQLPLEESELIRSMLGTVLFFSGRCADAVAIVEPLIELDVFPLDASPALASAWSVLGSPQRMLDLFDRVCSEMRAGLTRQETAWTMPVVNLTFNRLLALMQVGRLPEAEDPYGPIRDISGDPLATTDFMNRSLRATYFQLRGHLDAASAGYAGVGLELRYAPVQVIMMNHNYVATVEVLRGDVEVVRREFRGLDAIDPSSRAGLRWWEERPRMLLLAAEGDVDAAISRAMELADEFAEECLYRTWTLHDVVRMGRSELVVDSLAEMAGRDGSTWFDRACAASAAAGASRDSEALLGASATFEAGGLDLEALECAAWAARYATEPTVRARGRATASRLSERCGQVRTPAMTEVPPFLTPREFEVARLAASGLTNPEIGERLGTSARTVGNQLHHVYSKLGVSSRGELSAALG